MSTFDPAEPPAADDVPPVEAAAPPLTLLATPGTAFMPGTLLGTRAPWLGATFMPCVLFVFCEAVVDWLVTARLSLKTALWPPRMFVLELMPVAALGFTYCSGFVCE